MTKNIVCGIKYLDDGGVLVCGLTLYICCVDPKVPLTQAPDAVCRHLSLRVDCEWVQWNLSSYASYGWALRDRGKASFT